MEVLIFDDDPIAAELICDLIIERGGKAHQFQDALKGLEIVRERQPDLVILDIMMPGVDGLTLCRQIKADQQTSAIPVVIISAKDFAEDRENAMRCGAVEFIQKPFNLKRLAELLPQFEAAAAARPPRPEPPIPSPVMRVTIHGSRGPGGDVAGTQPTSSVVLEIGARRVILDAGTGLSQARLAGAQDAWLLLTHYHEDHLAGLGVLADLLGPECTLRVAGPQDARVDLQTVFHAYFGQRPLRARSQLYAVAESSFQLWPDVNVTALLTRHPGATLAYRFEHQGRAVVYCPDNELEDSLEVESDYTEKFNRFIRGADLLIHDARYSDEDYSAHAGQGHGSPKMAIAAARRQGVKRLALFHMDGRYDDAFLAKDLESLSFQMRDRYTALDVSYAAAGQSFEV